jgi:hypothetical protein
LIACQIMITERQDYSLFFSFLETYAPSGFKGIKSNDPLMVEVEKMMKENKQFFYIADIIQLKILYTSKGSKELIGIEPEEVTLYHFMEAVHPDEAQRLNRARSTVIKIGQELFIAGQGYSLMSSNYRFRNPTGGFSGVLVQGYLYYSSVPYKTVYFLKVHTNIDWCRHIKHGYYYYTGKDLSYFRYPDEKLLNESNIFTDREFEIIRLIESGLSTEQIAEKLFVSPFTINTHRRNILEKSGKPHISDLIYDLKENGLL